MPDPAPLEIGAYLHCKKCIDEMPKGESPQSWARTQAGWTKQGIQIWCNRHNENVAHLDFLGQKISYAVVRDAEEKRLNYCKNCGSDLDKHDALFCANHEYPALEEEYNALTRIAKLYEIDLTEANSNNADRGRHGSMMGHINLDVCGLISDFQGGKQTKTLQTYVREGLLTYSYEPEEIENALKLVEALK